MLIDCTYRHVTDCTFTHTLTYIYIYSFSRYILQERLRWSRSSVLAFSTQVRGFKPGRSHRTFRAKKSSARLPSEGKCKPSVPCRRYAACKRFLNWIGSRNVVKIVGQFLAHSSTFQCQDLSRRCGRIGTWWRKWERLKAGESNGKLPLITFQDAVFQSHTGHMTGLWFLPARPLRLNTNEWMNILQIKVKPTEDRKLDYEKYFLPSNVPLVLPQAHPSRLVIPKAIWNSITVRFCRKICNLEAATGFHCVPNLGAIWFRMSEQH